MGVKSVLISAGEPSGDLYASNLVKDLKALDPDLAFFGLGGDKMRECGVDVLYDISKLALVGIVEVIKNIRAIKSAHDIIMAKIEKTKPDCAILVDYPGFNLKIAIELKKRGIPVIYYISPQVWIWGRSRIKIIARCVRKMVVFFKFEEELYKTYGIDAEFVGHPLLDVVKPSLSKERIRADHKLSPDKITISILPGSRTMEIKYLLKVMALAGSRINAARGGVQFIIAKHPSLPGELFTEALKGIKLDYRIADGDVYNALSVSDFAIVASGTATLETAIMGVPFVIAYRTSQLTAFLARLVADLRFMGLVNIIADREVVPELIQEDVRPNIIADKVLGLLSDPARLSDMRDGLNLVKSMLGAGGASKRAAAAILPLLN